MRLTLDIDGVFADFNSSYGRLLIAADGNRILTEWWNNNRVTPDCWDWDVAARYSPEVIAKVWGWITKKGSTFWRKLAPLPGAKETLKRLNGLSSRGHEIIFVTNRAGHKAKRQTEQWLYEVGGINYPTVILSGDKVPLLRSLEADYFIDDRLITMNDCGLLLPGCELFLLDQPYNREGRRDNYRVVGSVQESLEAVGLWN